MNINYFFDYVCFNVFKNYNLLILFYKDQIEFVETLWKNVCIVKIENFKEICMKIVNF